jgi:integrase
MELCKRVPHGYRPYLSALTDSVYKARTALTNADKPITVLGLKMALTGQEEERYTILGAFKQHNEQMQALIGTEFAKSTLTRYKTAHDHTASFIRWKYSKDDLDVKDLNYEFVSQFDFWLKTERSCKKNAALKYIGNLKKIVLECMKKGWIKGDPFANFKGKRTEVIRTALTKTELTALTEKVFVIERLNHVRDIFLFSCYTGLAYVDVYRLRRSNIVDGFDGTKWLMTARQKTDTPTRLPLLPAALEIIDRCGISKNFNIPHRTPHVCHHGDVKQRRTYRNSFQNARPQKPETYTALC